MRRIWMTMAVTVAVFSWACAQEVRKLTSFEDGDPKAVIGGKIVEENATDGKKCVQLTSDEKKYRALQVNDGTALRNFHGCDKILVDVVNPGKEPFKLDYKCLDTASDGMKYDTWFNGRVVVPPGRSTVEFNMSNLVRESTRRGDKPEKFDSNKISLFVIFFSPSKDQVTLFFDNFRLSRPAPTTATAPASTTAPASSPAVSAEPSSRPSEPAGK